MESTLHRQLKQWYASPGDQLEAQVGRFRVDVLSDDHVLEIQQAGLGALRTKVAALLRTHRVTVVKPICRRKQIVTCSKTGQVLRSRRSPKRGSVLDLFHDLVHFVTVFPHPRLALEVVLVDVEEWRSPRTRRRSRLPYRVDDRRLLQVGARQSLRRAADLLALLPVQLPPRFDTRILADHLCVPRWHAQQIAYCLRQCGAVEEKERNRVGRQYALPALDRGKPAARPSRGTRRSRSVG